MHIVIVSRVLPHHSIGGMQAVAWDLARTLANHGNRMTVITTEIEGKPSVFFEGGIKVLAIPDTSWRSYGVRWWRESRRLFEQQLACDCDAVLSVSAAGVGLLAIRRRFPRIRFLMQAHGTSLGEVRSKWKAGNPKSILSSARNLLWLLKDLRSYPRFDAVVAVGSRVADELRGRPIRWVLRKEKLHVISNGIDVDRFRPDPQARQGIRLGLGWHEKTFVIVSASRLHKQKGLHLGLHAFAKLAEKKDNARYLIVGDGPEKNELHKQVRKMGLEGKVHFMGKVAREELPGLLQAADVMLFTTLREEGLPLNVLEALAVGLPCVVSRHVFDGHELAASEHIHLVQADDANAVAEAILRAEERSGRGAVALPEHFSLTACGNRYLRLLATLDIEHSANLGSAAC